MPFSFSHCCCSRCSSLSLDTANCKEFLVRENWRRSSSARARHCRPLSPVSPPWLIWIFRVAAPTKKSGNATSRDLSQRNKNALKVESQLTLDNTRRDEVCARKTRKKIVQSSFVRRDWRVLHRPLNLWLARLRSFQTLIAAWPGPGSSWKADAP